ncbi:hypothetical protein [Vibrio alginolyticus]|uniref:hypothetical protein n=1 Tax=Vibrio alginolyticus TaxID=663 RepID=UPI0013038C63|nr:hypothetical protein [Vibrio alginolyticus]
MGKIKITYYEYINDVEVAFENAMNEIMKEKDSSFDNYDYTMEDCKNEYFDDFEKWYLNPLARVEFNPDLIEYMTFTCEGYVFYNVFGDDVCFTDYADADFESMERYIEKTREKLRTYIFDLNDICYISADIEPREIRYVENVYFEADDIKEY